MCVHIFDVTRQNFTTIDLNTPLVKQYKQYNNSLQKSQICHCMLASQKIGYFAVVFFFINAVTSILINGFCSTPSVIKWKEFTFTNQTFGSLIRSKEKTVLPPFHNVSHSSISHIHIDVNESRHTYLFRFINININIENARITYLCETEVVLFSTTNKLLQKYIQR